MKIRILGNSIRLRLAQQEVQQLAADGIVEQQTHFGANQYFSYSLEKYGEAELSAQLSACHIRIMIPAVMADAWAASNTISLENKWTTGPAQMLRILIEKDFKCLTDRGEDESDLFPNPEERC